MQNKPLTLGAPGVPEPQAALDKIIIHENGESLVDISRIQNITFTKDPAHHLTKLLRKSVAEMLANAAASLAPSYRLRVISAHRSMESQQEIWNFFEKKFRSEHPEWSHAVIRRACNRYAAPTDHKAPPGHTTGAAVDVLIEDLEGNVIDVIPPHIENWKQAHTRDTSQSREILERRMILVKAMLDAGFSNCRDEYWHYSWGDSGWAVRTGKKECVYGAIEAPIR